MTIFYLSHWICHYYMNIMCMDCFMMLTATKFCIRLRARTGYPDFLYKSHDFKAILDTKYIPKYDESYLLDNYVVRQLSGYSRDLPILQKLGYNEIDEESPLPDVPCIIIYPKERDEITNPFSENKLQDLCRTPVRRLMRFYKSAYRYR